MGAVRSRLRRWHVWLGWIVGLPVLLWVVTGLVMVWKPIEEVRGEHLLRPPPAIGLPAEPVPPRIGGLPLARLLLEARAGGPRWVAALKDGTVRTADPMTGAWLKPYSAAEAVAEVAGRYTGKARVVSAVRTDPARPPIDLRRDIAAWQVTMSDGTRFYVDAWSGEIVARRTRWWRFYDLMWGLHIMDPSTREDTHNPWVIGFGIAALAMSLLALVLLPLTTGRRRRRKPS